VYPEDMPYGCTLQQINCHDSKYRGSFGFHNLHSDTFWAAVAFDPSQSYVNSLPDDVLYDLRVARIFPDDRWNTDYTYDFDQTASPRTLQADDFLIASVYPEDMPYGCTLQQINCHDSKYRGSFGFPRLNGNRQLLPGYIQKPDGTLITHMILLRRLVPEL
jgi:hypothetical protein